MLQRYRQALDEMGDSLGKVGFSDFDAAVNELAGARRIALYGVGREGLQIRGLAMRLFHLGLAASVVGDMATPYLGEGDVLVVSAGPGDFSDRGRKVSRRARPGGHCPAGWWGCPQSRCRLGRTRTDDGGRQRG